VCQKVELVVDHKDENALADALKGTNAVRNKPNDGKWRAIIFDSKTSGELKCTRTLRFEACRLDCAFTTFCVVAAVSRRRFLGLRFQIMTVICSWNCSLDQDHTVLLCI